MIAIVIRASLAPAIVALLVGAIVRGALLNAADALAAALRGALA